MVNNYLPMGLLSALIVRALISGANLPEMIIATALVGLLTAKEFLDKQKSISEVRALVTKELEEIKLVVKTQNEVIEKMARKSADQETAIASVKLSQGMRSVR